MYLWIGLGIDNNSAYEIRNYCKMLNKDYNVSEQSFTLPQHVYLKESFKTDDYKNIIFDLKNYFKNMKQFELKISDIGNIPGVIWLEIEENEILRKLHNDILNLLKDKYNINKIGFDGETFKFHSTLFQDVDNKEKINNLYEVIDKELQVMDLAAFTLARDHGMPIRVFNMCKPGALRKVVLGTEEGTTIS